jgi:hypothetical protein
MQGQTGEKKADDVARRRYYILHTCPYTTIRVRILLYACPDTTKRRSCDMQEQTDEWRTGQATDLYATN